MVATLVFRAPRGGIWRPNVLKVTSGHVALCVITIAKTYVFTECHFSVNLHQSRPQGHPKVTLGCHFGDIWVPVPVFWRALDNLWHTWGPTVDLVGFRGAGRPPEACRRQGHGDLSDCGKTALGPPGGGFYLGNTHIQQSCGMCHS